MQLALPAWPRKSWGIAPNKSFVIALVGSILLNFALVVFGRGSFVHTLAVIALVIYVALPATLLGILTLPVAFGRPWTSARTVSRIAFGVAFALGSSLVSLPMGAAILKQDIEAAKMYCESLIPQLDEHKRSHGEFPRDIGSIGDLAKLPRLLRGWQYYGSDGSEFSFSFVDPSGMMNGYGYYSLSRRWHKWD